jgi:hypothetical protein
MGMESTLKNSVFIAIFAIAIVTFAVSFAIDNDSDISLAEDSRYGALSTGLQSDIDSLQADAETSNSILQKTSLASGDQEIAGSGGQFKVGPYGAIKMTIKSFTTSFNTLFGPEFNFILIAFVSLLTFLIGYYIIKAWLGKDPS